VVCPLVEVVFKNSQTPQPPTHTAPHFRGESSITDRCLIMNSKPTTTTTTSKNLT